MVTIQRRAALEGKALAAQTHATPKELDDLRAFLATDVQQAHVGDAPRIPAFHKLLSADKDVDVGIKAVDGLEQGAGEGVFLQRDPRRVRFDQLLEGGGVADVDKAEIVVGAGGLEAQLAGAAADVAQV